MVHVAAYASHAKFVTSGVIHGNVLGSLPFLSYAVDVFKVIRNVLPFLFANDIKIVYTFQ